MGRDALKIIFLDIDGVVLPGRAYMLPYQTTPIVKAFDPCSVSLLNAACEEAGWKIVIHSSWLRYWQPSGGDITVMAHCINEGIKAEYFHPTEPHCSSAFHYRYNRIDDWLSRHKEISEFVILDDCPPEEGYPRTDKVILTDFDEGITLDIYRRLTDESRTDQENSD
jgi:hypothetical protein